MIRFFGQRRLTFSNLCRKTSSGGLSSRAAELTAAFSQRPVDFDPYAYSLALRHSIQSGDFTRATALHCDAVKRGNCLDTFAFNTLLSVYVKLSLVDDARKVFDDMPDRNTVSFVTLIRGLSESELFDESLELFSRLHRDGHELNGFVFSTTLNLLVKMGRAELSESVHGCALKLGLDIDAFVGSALIDCYSVSGQADMGLLVFQGIAVPDIVCWSGIISCCSDNGHFQEAMSLFKRMRIFGLNPNNFTFASILKACDGLGLWAIGKSVHGFVLKSRYDNHQFVALALLELYSNSGSELDTLRLFEHIPKNEDVVPWSFMISRYAQKECAIEACDLFVKMRQVSVQPNEFTCASVSQACSNLQDLVLGKQIHCHVVKSGLETNIFVSNAVMDLYAKCGKIKDSEKIFKNNENSNNVTWNTLIVGYVQTGIGEKALTLFSKMIRSGILATEVTFSSVLRACAGASALDPGLQIHSLAIKTKYDKDIAVGNSLIDMYAKSGRILDARSVFDRLTKRDVVAWNSMISGYSLHGLGTKAIELFETMIEMNFPRPNELTFVGVLSACNNSGLLEQGKSYFDRMKNEFNIEPCIEHYTCMVGLFGRMRQFQNAVNLMVKIPFEPSVMIWRTLLGSCVVHRETELGIYSAKRALEIDPLDDATHVLLSNLYANSKSWDKVALVRKGMKKTGVRKNQGLSWVESQGKVIRFSVGKMSHPDSKLIRAMLEWLNLRTRRAGFKPSTEAVLRQMEESEKERHLWVHSERLALAFGIIRIPKNSAIRIIKNLRICTDCHVLMKLVSKILKREIVVRDLNRFHSFRDGVCSCSDCW